MHPTERASLCAALATTSKSVASWSQHLLAQSHLLAQANRDKHRQMQEVAKSMGIKPSEFDDWGARLVGATPKALDRPNDVVLNAQKAEAAQLVGSGTLTPEQISRLRLIASALVSHSVQRARRERLEAQISAQSDVQNFNSSTPQSVLQQLKKTIGFSALPDEAKSPGEFAIAAKRLAQRHNVPDLREAHLTVSLVLGGLPSGGVNQSMRGELQKAETLLNAALKVPQFVFGLPSQRDREIRADFGSLTTGGKVTSALSHQNLSYKVVPAFGQGPPGSLVGKAMFLEGHQIALGRSPMRSDDRQNMTIVEHDYSMPPRSSGPESASDVVYGYRGTKSYSETQVAQLKKQGVLLAQRPAFNGESIAMMLREKFLGTASAAGTGRPDYIYLSVCYSGSTRAADIAPRIAQLTGVPVVAPAIWEEEKFSIGGSTAILTRGLTRYTSDGKIQLDSGNSRSHMVIIYPDGSNEPLPGRIPNAGISLAELDQRVRSRLREKGFGLQ